MDLFSFKGVMSRWPFFLVMALTSALSYFGTLLAKHPSYDVMPLAVLSGATLLVLSVWFSLAATVRRLHDRNNSGWWAVVSFVPIGNLFLLIYLLCWPSIKFGNKYSRAYYDGDADRTVGTW